MDVNENNIKAITFLFERTLDADNASRTKAEQELLALTGQAGLVRLLLYIIRENQIPLLYRQAAATFFKNYVRKHWDSTTTISVEEKEATKDAVVDLMLTVDGPLRRLVSAALYEISSQDFPDNWPKLLPTLVQKLQNPDPVQVNGVLKVCNSIFKRFRSQVGSDTVLKQLIGIFAVFSNPLLIIFKMTLHSIEENMSNPKALQVIFTSMRLLCGIFYSLSYVDLPEFFEDNLGTFFTGFKGLLTFPLQVPELIEGKDESSAGLLHKIQSSVFNILNLFAEKYEEEFLPFLPAFVQDTWNLLLKTPLDAKYDHLVTSALQFLTSIASGVSFSIFQSEGTIQQICENICVPNMRLRKSDKELFEDDPLGYVRKDVEGSDTGTRRRSAYSLIKGLTKHFEKLVIDVLNAQIGKLLEEYNTKQSWVAKDTAVYLVIAMATKKYSSARGVLEVTANIPILDFYRQHVLEELKGDKSKHLLLKSSSLTFVNNFRRQFTNDDFAVLFPLFISYLSVDSFVIRSYAAMCIERFLSVRIETNKPDMKWTKVHLNPFLGPVLTALFTALEPTNIVENHYVMKAIARVLALAREDVPHAAFFSATQAISTKLLNLYKHPVNAEFGHFLFEALAAIINTMCSKDKQENINNMEAVLMPIFSRILTEADGDTYSPYVFQIMSQLIESRGALHSSYQPLLAELVKARFWEENGNHPALVRLLQAYVVYGPEVVAPQLIPILGVFQRLVSSKRNDFLGFYLLESIVNHIDPQAYTPYLLEVFKIVFSRIQNSKTVQLVKSFTIFLCSFMSKQGASFVVEKINTVQDGIFWMVLKSLWIPNMHGISGKVEKKAVAVGSTKLLCEFAPLLSEQGLPLWKEVLQGLLKLFGGAEEAAPTADYEEAEEDLVFNSGFSTLQYAAHPQRDYFADIPSGVQYFVQAFSQLAQAHGGQIGPVVRSLGPEYLSAYANTFQSCSCPIPFA